MKVINRCYTSCVRGVRGGIPLFSVNDPWGRSVSVTPDNWLNHIVSNHPDLANLEALVQATIRDPDFVRFDVNPATNGRERFYRRLSVSLYVKVCVAFEASTNQGTIVTAHRLTRFKKGEVQEWP